MCNLQVGVRGTNLVTRQAASVRQTRGIKNSGVQGYGGRLVGMRSRGNRSWTERCIDGKRLRHFEKTVRKDAVTITARGGPSTLVYQVNLSCTEEPVRTTTTQTQDFEGAPTKPVGSCTVDQRLAHVPVSDYKSESAEGETAMSK